jgi:lipid A 3-O-deacylase
VKSFHYPFIAQGTKLIRKSTFFLLVFASATLFGQGPNLSSASAIAAPEPSTAAPEPAASAGNYVVADPVGYVRERQPWEMGPFLNWGTGVGDRSDFKFFWGGVELGKVLTPVVHAGIFSGQFQFAGNIMPLWQAYTPAPHLANYTCINPTTNQPYTCPLEVGGGTFRGVSITPVILRWNFLTKSRRFQPWFQGAGGLIYTTHKFPPNVLSYDGIDGGTCVWNFSPQGGFGVHYFTKPKRSIDLTVNGVHISSASLGDRNPGVNASVQVQVGYTFWK